MTKSDLLLKKKKLELELSSLNICLSEFDFDAKKSEYGDKFCCKHCRYSAVSDCSFDGWHNVCGADVCTCCHSACDKYQPDNEVTLFIKNGINGYGYLSKDEYKAVREIFGDIFNIDRSINGFKELLSVCFGLKKENE